MVLFQVEAPAGAGGASAIPSISLPAHRVAAFLHKSSTGSCTEAKISRTFADRAEAGKPACRCQHGTNGSPGRRVVARCHEGCWFQGAPIVRGARPRGPSVEAAGQPCFGTQGRDLSPGRLPAAVAVKSSVVSCTARRQQDYVFSKRHSGQ